MQLFELAKPFKSNLRAWFGTMPLLCLKDPEDIKTLLTSSGAFEKPVTLYKQLFSYGFLTIGGTPYRRQRKAVERLFHPTSLTENLPTINRKMKSFMDKFDKNINPEIFDISHTATDFTLDTLLATTFEMDSASEETRKKFVHNMTK